MCLEILAQPPELLTGSIELNLLGPFEAARTLHVQPDHMPASDIEAVPVPPRRTDAVRAEVGISAGRHAAAVVRRDGVDLHFFISQRRVVIGENRAETGVGSY